MKSVLFLSALVFSVSEFAIANEFEKLGALYDATKVEADAGWSLLKKSSAWTGKCVTSRDPDKYFGAYFLTYDPSEGIFSADPYANLVLKTNQSQPLNDNEGEVDAEIKEMFDARKKFAIQVALYKNEIGWIRGRGFEVTTIRPEISEGSISRLHLSITCIGDEETCKKRAISHGRWRHCLFDKKRI